MARYRIEHRYPCYANGGCIPYDGYFVQKLEEGFFTDEVSWQKVDPQAAAAEDITEGGDNQGGNQGGGTTVGELEG